MCVSDPEMVQDLYGQKNSIFDKTGITRSAISRLMGDSFLFSPSDEAWKAKRKASSHAFFKDRLKSMAELLKEKMAEQVEAWAKRIRESPEGYTEIDLASDVRVVIASHLIHIVCGEDISEEPVQVLHCQDTYSEGTEPVVVRQMSFVRALDHISRSVFQISVRRKHGNPLHRLIYSATGKSVSFSSIERVVDKNCQMLRDFVGAYIIKRRQGERRSTVQSEADLLTLFF